MELRTLKYFLTVAREENFTRAAELLHITQPTLSRQLMQLEEEVGAQLFNRLSRKITLTQAGLILRRRAEEIVGLVQKTEKEISTCDEMVEGEISIGAGELYAVQYLPPLIKSFREIYPNVTFEIYTGNADQIKERIEDGLTDIGVMLEPVSIEKYEFIRLKDCERWVVLMPPDDPLTAKSAISPQDDPLTAKSAISPQDLAGKNVFLVSRGTVRNEIASWFGSSFKDIIITGSGNLPANKAIMVKEGLGYALIIGSSITFWDEKYIAWRPLQPEMRTSSVIAWKRHQPHTPAVEKFIAHLRDNLPQN